MYIVGCCLFFKQPTRLSNKRLMKRTILLVFFPLWLFAQPRLAADIRGTWKGYVKTSEKKIDYELVVGEKSGTLTAFSKIVFVNNGEEYFAIKSVLIKKENQRYIFEEDKLLSDNFKEDAPKKIRQINTLEINSSDNELILSGTFKTRPIKELRIAMGDVSVSKSTIPDSSGFYAELNKLGFVKDLKFDSSDPIEGGLVNEPDAVLLNKNKEPASVTTYSLQSTITSSPAAQPDISIDIPLPEPSLFLDNNYVATTTINYALPMARLTTLKKIKTKNIIVKAVPSRSRNNIINSNKNTPAPVVVKTTPTAKPVTPTQPITKSTPAPIVASKTAEKPATVVTPIVAPVVVKPTPKPPVIAPGSASDLNNRKIETIETVYFDSDSLKLTLYDNGEVDGDTVSVVVNGKVFMGKKGLSTNAISETIYITPELGDSLQMIMYAENLGSIGKNTGLLIVQDGKERHEIRFSGDLNKNAAVIFKRRR